MENSNIVEIKEVITEHPKILYKLFSTIRQKSLPSKF